MSLRELFAWCLGLWIAAGIEAAVGAGFPGPLLLIAIAAGLSSGTIPGLIVGAMAGFCSAALGGHLLLYTFSGIACGIAASLIARYFSHRNIIVAMLTSAIMTGVLGILLCVDTGLTVAQICKYASVRGGINALWMFPIYGIVLIVSSHRLYPSKVVR